MRSIEISTLTDELVAAVPRLRTRERRIAIALYRLLGEGNPVAAEHLARHLNSGADEVRQVLANWPGVYRDERGDVIGFWGLAIPEMPHRFVVDGIRLHTWCAWDALFIPEILGKAARVESTCPATGQLVALTVAPDGVQAVSPSGVVVSFLSPRGQFDENVHANFCHFVHFFASRETGAAWTAAHPHTFLLSVDEAFEVGRRFNAARFGGVLRSGSLAKGRRSTHASC